MVREHGLRDRKKAQTRHRLADVAARLFAEHGYDAVSIADVAHAADVSDQTVYNYFSAKQELVLDRAEEIRERYVQVVLDRARGTSPAAALRVLVIEDIVRFQHADGSLARGEFPAQCLKSPVLRRYALEARESQADSICEATVVTCPTLHPVVARAHAAAVVSVIQTITDQIGACVLDGADRDTSAQDMTRAAEIALSDLDRCFRIITLSAAKPRPPA